MVVLDLVEVGRDLKFVYVDGLRSAVMPAAVLDRSLRWKYRVSGVGLWRPAQFSLALKGSRHRRPETTSPGANWSVG